MILYHGGLNSYRFRTDEPKIPRLDTYYHAQKKPRKESWADPLFMDSGAFSVWKQGGTLSLDTYMEYLRTWKDLIHVYAALDVIGSAEGSFENYLRMRDAGLDPIPCFHHGEPLSWLEKYVEAGATYIGLGAVAKASTATRWAFLREVFQRFPDPAKVGFHGFGVTAEDMLTAFPWKSCDSTAAVMTASFGTIITPFGNATVAEGLDAGRSAKQTPAVMDKLRSWVESVGGDWDRAVQKTPDGAYERAWVSIRELTRLANTAPLTYIPTVKGFHL